TIETIQNYSTTISAATNITTNYAFNTESALLSATSVTTENAAGTGTQTQITVDQNGTQHNYGIDGLGRQVSDTATVLGANVDGTVRRIDTAYDFQGNVELT